MKIYSQKFRSVLVLEDDAIITFRDGLIGFSDETEFVLLQREQSPRVAWLQSVKTPEFAIPVISTHELAFDYPDIPIERAHRAEGLPGIDEHTALMVVLTCQKGMMPTVNLMAPIVVDSRTRSGGQVLLEGSRFGTRELPHFVPREALPKDDSKQTEGGLMGSQTSDAFEIERAVS